jgi:uncharacterized protein (TIGR02145 family)
MIINMKKIIPVLTVIILIAACKNKKNSTGEPVSSPVTVIDSTVSDTVRIGSQLWMKINLNTTHYRNGDVIAMVTDQTSWGTLTTGAWCYYDNDSAVHGATYGKLYNWYAVNDPRGLAPAGYHIPSDAEWTTLETALGGDLVAGGAMKDTGTTHWDIPNTEATNSSGFTGLPGGILDYNVSTGYGACRYVSVAGFWWSSTESSASKAWGRHLNADNSKINRDENDKVSGFSVRCIRD